MQKRDLLTAYCCLHVLIFYICIESWRDSTEVLVVTDHRTLTPTPSQQHDRGGMLATKLL